jgi:hypothetical protein
MGGAGAGIDEVNDIMLDLVLFVFVRERLVILFLVLQRRT